MADMLSDGLDYLTTTLHANASRNVTYKRGAHTVTVTAIIGRRSFLQQPIVGRASKIWSDRDFIIKVTDLLINSVAIEPRDGDRITDSLDNGVYELTPFNGEKSSQKVDNGGQWRCHTKRVG